MSFHLAIPQACLSGRKQNSDMSDKRRGSSHNNSSKLGYQDAGEMNSRKVNTRTASPGLINCSSTAKVTIDLTSVAKTTTKQDAEMDVINIVSAEEDEAQQYLKTLDAMFPSVDQDILQSYVDMYGSDPNCVPFIASLLLGENSATLATSATVPMECDGKGSNATQDMGDISDTMSAVPRGNNSNSSSKAVKETSERNIGSNNTCTLSASTVGSGVRTAVGSVSSTTVAKAPEPGARFPASVNSLNCSGTVLGTNDAAHSDDSVGFYHTRGTKPDVSVDRVKSRKRVRNGSVQPAKQRLLSQKRKLDLSDEESSRCDSHQQPQSVSLSSCSTQNMPATSSPINTFKFSQYDTKKTKKRKVSYEQILSEMQALRAAAASGQLNSITATLDIYPNFPASTSINRVPSSNVSLRNFTSYSSATVINSQGTACNEAKGVDSSVSCSSTACVDNKDKLLNTNLGSVGLATCSATTVVNNHCPVNDSSATGAPLSLSSAVSQGAQNVSTHQAFAQLSKNVSHSFNTALGCQSRSNVQSLQSMSQPLATVAGPQSHSTSQPGVVGRTNSYLSNFAGNNKLSLATSLRDLTLSNVKHNGVLTATTSNNCQSLPIGTVQQFHPTTFMQRAQSGSLLDPATSPRSATNARLSPNPQPHNPNNPMIVNVYSLAGSRAFDSGTMFPPNDCIKGQIQRTRGSQPSVYTPSQGTNLQQPSVMHPTILSRQSSSAAGVASKDAFLHQKLKWNAGSGTNIRPTASQSSTYFQLQSSLPTIQFSMQMESNPSSNQNTSHIHFTKTADGATNGATDPSLVSDTDILCKVYPDTDRERIMFLLSEEGKNCNRVAAVGQQLAKELHFEEETARSSNTNSTKEQSFLWFWESLEGKLVSFSPNESRYLEKLFKESPWPVFGEMQFHFPSTTHQCLIDFSKMVLRDQHNCEMFVFRVPCEETLAPTEDTSRNIPQEALVLPSHWQTQTDCAELVTVRCGSAEWEHVERLVKRSLPKCRVTRLERVQNKLLYKKYAIQRSLLRDKNGSSGINERELFHGTRAQPPEVVWRNEDGFDMRHSRDGMWGRGAYFAEDIAYCHAGRYSYNTGGGFCYQVLMAHVLTGDSVTLAPDRSIRMPPFKPVQNVRFDSINGDPYAPGALAFAGMPVNGSRRLQATKIYIVYKMDVAYPAYLITYTTYV